MKEKEVVTKDNYKLKTLKRMIILCWSLLGICFIIKILGGNFFNIVCKDERFLRFCNFIDNSVFYYISAFIQFVASSMLIYLAISNKRIKIFLPSIIVVWAYKMLVEFNIIKINIGIYVALDYLILFLLMWICSGKPLKSIISVILNIVFVVISAITKNLFLGNFIITSYTINLIYAIDYYIMIVLYYLYSKYRNIKKEDK